VGCATVLGAWILHLRGLGAPVQDPGAEAARAAAAGPDLPSTVPSVLDTLATDLGSDTALVDAVLEQMDALTPPG